MQIFEKDNKSVVIINCQVSELRKRGIESHLIIGVGKMKEID